MPNEPEARDRFASAALRHLGDARDLGGGHPARSPDQAWHLIGYAPECARKAAFASPWAAKALGHELGAPGDELAAWLVALEPLAHRYRAGTTVTWIPALERWRPDSRYDATGAAMAERRPLVDAIEQAEHFVSGRLAMLWADGLLRAVPEVL